MVCHIASSKTPNEKMLSLILTEHEKLIGKVAWRESCLEIGKVHCRKLQSFWMSFDKFLLLHVKSSNFEFPAKIIKRALFWEPLEMHVGRSTFQSTHERLVLKSFVVAKISVIFGGIWAKKIEKRQKFEFLNFFRHFW